MGASLLALAKSIYYFSLILVVLNFNSSGNLRTMFRVCNAYPAWHALKYLDGKERERGVISRLETHRVCEFPPQSLLLSTCTCRLSMISRGQKIRKLPLKALSDSGMNDWFLARLLFMEFAVLNLACYLGTISISQKWSAKPIHS